MLKGLGEEEISTSCGSFHREVREYVLKERVGGGEGQRLSVVWRAEHRSSGHQVVLKQIFLSKLNCNLKSCLDCELNFLASVKHPNIIRLLDVIEVSLRVKFSSSLFLSFVSYMFSPAQNRSKNPNFNLFGTYPVRFSCIGLCFGAF